HHEEIPRRPGGMMALDDVDLQDQAVQYVLGELPAADARALEARMTSDAELAVEVRRLRATLGLLPYATATEPTPGRVAAARAERRQVVRRRRRRCRRPGRARPRLEARRGRAARRTGAARG